MKQKKENKILKTYLESGIVWIENNEYVGKGKDGVIVNIGCVGYEEDIISYLENVSPENW
jgi:hypothetical protein